MEEQPVLFGCFIQRLFLFLLGVLGLHGFFQFELEFRLLLIPIPFLILLQDIPDLLIIHESSDDRLLTE